MTAIFRNSDRLTKEARNSDDPIKHIIFRCWICTSPYDLAPCLIAYKNLTGDYPEMPQTPLWQSALQICHNAYNQGLEVVHGRTTEKGLVTNYDITPPSDEARRQAYQAREAAGYYKGIRRLSHKTDRVPLTNHQLPKIW